MEESRWEIEGFGLHILRQSQGDCPGVGRAGQHPQSFRQRQQNLLRPVDPVPVAADGFEAVVDREILAMRSLQLLEDRGDITSGEDIAGQEQHRQPVDGRAGGGGDHIGRARANGRGADQGLQSVFHFGEGRGGMNHGLLVAGLVVAKVRILLQSLTNAGHVAMTKDAETTGKEGLLDAVPFDVLVFEKLNDRLRGG